MNTSTRFPLPLAAVLALGVSACTEPPLPSAAAPPPEKAAADQWPAPADGVKRTELAKNVFLEVLPDKSRRVALQAEVCFREGPLELLMCKKFTKEHEAVLNADVDGRRIHAALLVCGAKPGQTVQYEPKFKAPSGPTIKVLLQFNKDGKTVTVPGKEWVRNAQTKKELATDWVFAGSQFYPDPDDPKLPPRYAANGGDLICVSNFDSAMLDLPINSSKDNADLQFEANTPVIPAIGTKVIVILEPKP